MYPCQTISYLADFGLFCNKHIAHIITKRREKSFLPKCSKSGWHCLLLQKFNSILEKWESLKVTCYFLLVQKSWLLPWPEILHPLHEQVTEHPVKKGKLNLRLLQYCWYHISSFQLCKNAIRTNSCNKTCGVKFSRIESRYCSRQRSEKSSCFAVSSSKIDWNIFKSGFLFDHSI